jgi:hypothetical protein
MDWIKAMAYTMLTLVLGRTVMRRADGGPVATTNDQQRQIASPAEPADDDDGHEDVAVNAGPHEQEINNEAATSFLGDDDGYRWDQRMMSQPWNSFVYAYEDPLPPRPALDDDHTEERGPTRPGEVRSTISVRAITTTTTTTTTT